MRLVLVEKARLPARSLIVRAMKFYRSKLIIIRVSLPALSSPRPRSCAFIPQNKHSARLPTDARINSSNSSN